jgi:plastocyanin
VKYVIFAALAILGLTLILSQNASAEIGGNKGFALVGNGFALSENSIAEASVDLLFTTNQMKNKIDFGLQNGMITLADEELNISKFSGTILKNGQIFKFSSKATDSTGKQFTVKALGKLVDKTPTDSIYSLTGTLTDSSNKITKLVFTTKVAEFTEQTTQKSQISDVTVKILPGASNPSAATYKDYKIGFRFKYFSEDRITITPGGTITFVNEDTVSHNLKSGTANYVSRHKTFTADGKISSGEITPGKSWSTTYNEPGFYRLFDEKYQWMDITVFVFDTSKIPITKTPLN